MWKGGDDIDGEEGRMGDRVKDSRGIGVHLGGRDRGYERDSAMGHGVNGEVLG